MPVVRSSQRGIKARKVDKGMAKSGEGAAFCSASRVIVPVRSDPT